MSRFGNYKEYLKYIKALNIPCVNGWLPIKKVSQLNRGDIIMHISGGSSYIVSENYGERATAVDTKDITNASEWLVLACR